MRKFLVVLMALLSVVSRAELGTVSIAGNAVTNSNLAQMPANSTKCNPLGTVGNASDCSTTQMLGVLLPSQTGQSGNFLSTNGTSVSWAPTGGGGATFPLSAPSSTSTIPYGFTVCANCGMRLATTAIDGYDGISIYDNGSLAIGVNRGSSQVVVGSGYTFAAGIGSFNTSVNTAVLNAGSGPGTKVALWGGTVTGLPGYGINTDSDLTAAQIQFGMYNGATLIQAFSWNSNTRQTVNGTAAGSVECDQLQDGALSKEVQCQFKGYTNVGNKTVTFTTAFAGTAPPLVYGNTATVAVSSATNTVLTIAGGSSLTGWVYIKGY